MPTWSKTELESWKKSLQAGEITASPAEGVYGYNADPFNNSAIENLLKLKQRNSNKGLILLLPNISFLPKLTENLTEEDEKAISSFWNPSKAPTTLILPAKSTLSSLLTGNKATIALRIPTNSHVLEYLNYWNSPLVSTSLNISGEKPLISPEKIPSNINTLKLNHKLSGEPSQIFNPQAQKFIR